MKKDVALKEFKLNAINRWLLYTGLTLLFLMSLSRLIFFFVFYRDSMLSEFAHSFTLGLKYDFRTVCIILLPIFLLSNFHLTYKNDKLTDMSMARIIGALVFFTALAFIVDYNRFSHWLLIPVAILCAAVMYAVFKAGTLNPFLNQRAAMIYQVYFAVMALVLAIFYVVDFTYFDYLHHRLNATVLNFVEDAMISAYMVLQSYPVGWLALLIVGITAIFYFSCRAIFKRINTTKKEKTYRTAVDVTIFSVMVIGIFGSITPYPLRWSDAFVLGSDDKANVALNPIQSFFSSLMFDDAYWDPDRLKAYYPLMTRVMNVPNADTSNITFLRRFTDSSAATPNVVLVVCESFSAYKSSMWGNPLNTTPAFNELTRQGIFFENCFTPAYGTARGLFATITGIADVEIPNTASRNPAAVDQHTIWNDIKGYEKFYLIGGSTSWANLQGLLHNNIDGLHLYEQENYKSKPVDIWGISDKRLLLEANDIFKIQTKPFFAMIQTADNHPPYSIPSEDRGDFKMITMPNSQLKPYGFESNDELNAFRYFDFCISQFMDAARKEKYFENTIFVFIGDHGIPGKVGSMFPKVWEQQKLTAHHVPLLFYAPALLRPERIKTVCSQVDVFPSIAGLLKKPYLNTTLGRDLFSLSSDSGILKQHAFLFDPDQKKIGIITSKYCYTRDFIKNSMVMLSVTDNEPVPVNSETESIKKTLAILAEAYWETSKWMMLNNKKGVED